MVLDLLLLSRASGHKQLAESIEKLAHHCSMFAAWGPRSVDGQVVSVLFLFLHCFSVLLRNMSCSIQFTLSLWCCSQHDSFLPLDLVFHHKRSAIEMKKKNCSFSSLLILYRVFFWDRIDYLGSFLGGI